MIDPISAISIASSGITVTTSPDYLLDGLTGVYVLLTVVIAVIAFKALSKTQTSLELTRNQIAASERQSQEALYNQHKPVLVPIDLLEGSSPTNLTLKIQNKGLGVAFNTWGMLSIGHKPPINPHINGVRIIYNFNRVYMMVPDKEPPITLETPGIVTYPSGEFAGYTVFG